jgi:hypothetical protein
MDKVRKPNISVCYTPSSEPYSIYVKITVFFSAECTPTLLYHDNQTHSSFRLDVENNEPMTLDVLHFIRTHTIHAVTDPVTNIYDYKSSGLDSRQGQNICLYPTASRPTLGPTQPPIQWVPGALSHGVKAVWA